MNSPLTFTQFLAEDQHSADVLMKLYHMLIRIEHRNEAGDQYVITDPKGHTYDLSVADGKITTTAHVGVNDHYAEAITDELESESRSISPFWWKMFPYGKTKR